MVCTFFGHRDAPPKMKEHLYTVLESVIKHNDVTTFYFGGQGNFDKMVKDTLMQLKRKYPHIVCEEVLAYLPPKACDEPPQKGIFTIYPEGMENVFPRFAIDARNRWMLEKVEVVITCVYRSGGGAAKYKRLAERMGKTVVEVSDGLDDA